MASEVLHYVGADVRIWFEADHVACKYCPLLETYSRNQCRRTGEYVININTIGYECPLDFAKGEDDVIQNVNG